MRALIAAAPGISELLFLGQLWWLTSLAEREAGLAFDRIVVDAPATGHAGSLLELPQTLATLSLSALLELEVGRVRQMMRDPAWTGALLVALPDELSVEETAELLPRTTRALGRAPLAAFVNRSTHRIFAGGDAPCATLVETLPPQARTALTALQSELHARVHYEQTLTHMLSGQTVHGVHALDEQLARSDDPTPLAIARSLAVAVDAHLAGDR